MNPDSFPPQVSPFQGWERETCNPFGIADDEHNRISRWLSGKKLILLCLLSLIDTDQLPFAVKFN